MQRWLLGIPGSAKYLVSWARCLGHQGSVEGPGWHCAYCWLTTGWLSYVWPGLWLFWLCRPPPLHSVLGQSTRGLAAAKLFEQQFQVAGGEWSRAGWYLCWCARRAACASPCQLIWGSTWGTARTRSQPAQRKLFPASVTLGSAGSAGTAVPLWWQ